MRVLSTPKCVADNPNYGFKSTFSLKMLSSVVGKKGKRCRSSFMMTSHKIVSDRSLEFGGNDLHGAAPCRVIEVREVSYSPTRQRGPIRFKIFTRGVAR